MNTGPFGAVSRCLIHYATTPHIGHVSLVSFRYGKVIGMYLGSFPTVVIYDFETVKELFNRDELQGRPDNFPYRFRMLGKRLGKDLVRF